MSTPFAQLIRCTAFAATALCLLSPATSVAQTTYASWNFETNTPADLTNSAASPLVNAEAGSGVASGVHATANADWTTPTGNNSLNSFSANEWAIGDYFQFLVTVPGLSPTYVSWDQTRSSTGPADFKLAWSFNGTDFNDFYTYSVIASTGTNIAFSDATTGRSWTSTKLATNTSYLVDLSGITVEFASSTLYVRLIATTSPTATAGTSRIDNVSFTSTAPAAIPEPSSYAVIAGALGLGFALYRRRARA